MRRAIVLICILFLAACDRTAAGTKEDPIPFTLEGVATAMLLGDRSIQSRLNF